jgi:membrane protein implicated in regulation of membrane protease activity
MSPVLQWISLGILFLVVETMILSLDFLSLGMAAILTGLIAWILPEEYASLLVLSSVFLVL